ncbi:MAG: formyltetrahydrofolate deformylase [Burkholderiales bacterium]|nr:formyltetrahydrofolate deformylase [Burkholderiales bacterium]
MHRKNTATLLVTCPDRKGLVAGISEFLYGHNANILHADQHQDGVLFLMRIEWDLEDFDIGMSEFRHHFEPIARKFDMQWRIADSDSKKRMAIFVSRYDHCLVDLLYRHNSGEFDCDIPLILGNHPDAEPIARFHGIPFHLAPVSPEKKIDAESRQLALLREHGIDFIVLARYMQVLSGDFVSKYADRIVNIHHSFLPAFHGAKPYHRAFERGVKLIGATAHYVTDILDEGPIIEQDVIRISHRDALEDLIQKGRDLEKIVLSRAVRWHLENRVLVYGNKTVVFD